MSVPVHTGGARWVYLGAGLSAVHDGVTAVEGEGILELGQTLLCELVSRVDHPAVGLEKEMGSMTEN